MPPHVIDVFLRSRLLSALYPPAPPNLERLSWIRVPLSRETPKPPHLPLVLHTALCPLLHFGSRLQCFAFPVSLVLALLSYVAILFFWVISYPRDCSPTVCHDPFSIAFILSVCLSPLRSPFVNPSLVSFPLPSHPLFPLYQYPLYNTPHLPLFHSSSISTRFQEPGTARMITSRLWYAHIIRRPHLLGSTSRFLLSQSYRRTFPRWLIIQLVSRFRFLFSFLS